MQTTWVSSIKTPSEGGSLPPTLLYDRVVAAENSQVMDNRRTVVQLCMKLLDINVIILTIEYVYCILSRALFRAGKLKSIYML